MPYDPQLAPLIKRTAGNLGINPSDLATSMSYETGGTFNPNLYGGAGGKYLGLIQAGPEEQAKYGIKQGQTLDQHMTGVENYLRDRGVRPGMGMLDLYSTINAGSPGRYNASDANNGGMPGTVADKVATQMVGHRARANALLGDENNPIPISTPVQTTQQAANAPAPGAEGPTYQPDANAAASQGGFDPSKLIAAIGAMKQQQPEQDAPPPPINIAQPSGLPVAQRLAAAMQRLGQTQG